MANRIVKRIGDTRESKISALKAARNSGATIWYDGTQSVPIGTHLFIAAEGEIFGEKRVESKIHGVIYLPIIAGKMIISKTNEEIVFDLNSETNTHKLFFPEKFQHLIEPEEKVYLTIDENSNGWTQVVNISGI